MTGIFHFLNNYSITSLFQFWNYQETVSIVEKLIVEDIPNMIAGVCHCFCTSCHSYDAVHFRRETAFIVLSCGSPNRGL